MKKGFIINRNRVRLSVCYGSDRKKTLRTVCRLPRGKTPSSISLEPFSLQLSGHTDILSGQISSDQEVYLRSLTMKIQLKTPGRFSYRLSGQEQSPYLALCHTETEESLVLARKYPVRQIIRFSTGVRKGILRIKWEFNCLLSPETPLPLDHVFIRSGILSDLLSKLMNDICTGKATPFNRGWDKTVWIPPQEPGHSALSLRKLEENLSLMEQERILYEQVQLRGVHPREGDWLHVHKDFRGKLGFITRRIEHNGMTPGLAFSPLCVSTGSELYKQHPEWMMQDMKGDITPVLDITRKEVREYLIEIMTTFREQWGFKAFHLQGLSCLLLPLMKKNNSLESGNLLSYTLSFFSENAGKGVSLSSEGIPYLPAMGNVSIMYSAGVTSPDQKPSEIFRQTLNSAIENAVLHKKIWISNPGFFPMGEAAEKLPLQMRESIRQIILMTGGVLAIHSDQTAMNVKEYQNLKDVMETFKSFSRGQLFLLNQRGKNRPVVLYNTIGKLGIFNLSKKPRSISLNLQELKERTGQGAGTYLKEGNTGMQTGVLDLILPPYGSRVFNF